MRLPLYQIDAFTGRLFSGNPAAVCPLAEWLPAEKMQAIAAENNLSETAFFVRRDKENYDLRWFTPAREVDLCGHATLASGFVILTLLTPEIDSASFHTRSGVLTVARQGKLFAMDLPAWPARPCSPPQALLKGLGRNPKQTLTSNYFLTVFDSVEEVRSLKPDFDEILKLGDTCVIATAPGEEVDFISRFFAPAFGILEDPVTGSAHCVLTPYWSARLGKKELTARQISARGGELFCTDMGKRVIIAGQAVMYLEGKISI
jgi:predicted PhzF superfamily epimerase YddE/YHI9